MIHVIKAILLYPVSLTRTLGANVFFKAVATCLRTINDIIMSEVLVLSLPESRF